MGDVHLSMCVMLVGRQWHTIQEALCFYTLEHTHHHHIKINQ